MSTAPVPSPDVLAALLQRVSQLEARLERLEACAPGRTRSEWPLFTAEDEAQLKYRVLQDFDRRERLQELREHPRWLAAIRERHAAINAIYEARGLTPDPDPYPELP